MTKSLRHANIMPLLTCFVQSTPGGVSQLWRVYPHIYFGSCRDILDCIEAYYCPTPAAVTPPSPLSSGGGGGTGGSDLHSPSSLAEFDEDNLVDLADQQKRLCFNEQSLQPITKALLSALEYLHAKHVVHRRVEPDSVYIDVNGHVYLGRADSAVSLLAQGGLAKRLHDYSHAQLSLDYAAPEILQQVAFSSINSGTKRILFLFSFFF